MAFHREPWSTSRDASGREPGSPVPSALLLCPWAECAGMWDQPPAFCRLAWELTAVGFMVSWGLGSVAEKPRPPSGLVGFRPLVRRPLSPFPGLQMGSVVCGVALEHLEGSLSPLMHVRWGYSEGLEEGGEPGLDRGLNAVVPAPGGRRWSQAPREEQDCSLGLREMGNAQTPRLSADQINVLSGVQLVFGYEM